MIEFLKQHIDDKQGHYIKYLCRNGLKNWILVFLSQYFKIDYKKLGY